MSGRIVVVDDEPITRLDIRDILEGAGHQVVGEASDGFEAIRVCQETKPDLVIMDIKMPILDGLTASKKIVAEGTTSGIILLTAYSDQQYIQKATSFGALGYLVKPLHEQSLLPMVELALAKGKEHEKMAKELETLARKLEERKVIEKAKGKLMATEQINEDAAYKKMRSISMQKRIPMIKVAELLVMLDE
ncbi:ANTAR domain-containing response regulator [Jeotgalibaca caeni]|uniref:ANTAR domain-containing response regulator n=1 Tax=Jeotgalibaca caeni TaxID=3028623 RepID=UPI00237EC5A9|nr:response regulator [Jeotgalibaca caeni]MDE1548761.1 response regulator [Jeotgalibaca caeni]